MSDEIQQTRYDRMIRRVTGIIGPGSKVAQVITELFPMINVEDPPPELLLLGGTNPASGGGTFTADAGEFGVLQLFNPANSGRLLTLTDVYFGVSANMVLQWGLSPTVFPTAPSSETSIDTRLFPPATPTGEVRAVSRVTAPTGTVQVRIAANIPFHIHNANGIAIISPGRGFEIGTTTAAPTYHWGFYWRERDAEASELNI